MEILDVDRQNRLLDLIEQGTHKPALELLMGDNHISHDELNKSLISACQRGYTFIVQKLVQLGANVNYRDTNGNTPLLISVRNGVTDIVKFLLSNKADVNACNSVGDSALILSIHSSGSTEITESLLKQAGINIDHQNQDGYTAIMKAAEVKDVETLTILLDEYFNVGCIPASFYELINEHKKQEHISTLRKTVNCKGENAHQIAERCGIGSVFQLLLEHERTKISHLELAMEANDIQSFHIFLDCDFIYAKKKKRYLQYVFVKMFLTCSNDGIVHVNENKIAMIKALLEHGVDVNTTRLDHIPRAKRNLHYLGELDAIQIAAKSGCFKILELLLSFKTNINRHAFRSSPLYIALSHGHTECAKLLIQHGAYINVNQVLELAVYRQEPKYVSFLIENCQNELMEHLKRTSEIQYILITAVRKGNLAIIGQILDLGADINGLVGCDRCPLAESKNGKVAKFLFDRGANVKHEKQTRSDPPLIQVLSNRESTDVCVIEVIKVLLENGASVNDRCRNGKTPLTLAAVKEGSMSVMQLLLDHGAELSERDKEGNTALILAVRAGCVKNVSFLLQFIKDRKELLNIKNDENGASLNGRCWNGKTLLMLAAVKEGNMSVMQLLLDHGAELCERDKEGNTALILAIMAGCVKNVLFLLQFIKDRKDLLNVQTDEGFTVLMLAVRVRNSTIIKKLIEAGCDVNCQNNYGHSPLMLAANYCSKDDMCVLLDSGAEINAVSRRDTTKTALTHLRYSKDMHNDYFSCLEYLLDRGASSSYLAETALHNMIVADVVHVVPKLIKCGLGPVCVLLNYILFFSHYNNMNTLTLRLLAYEVGKRFHCSPLCIALCVGNSALARFFVGNLFLTNYDVFLLGHNERIRHHLARMDHTECLDILTEITTQPMTLLNLSFVAVSTAVGATPGREIRVNKLPVPQIIKDKLLFKKQDVALTVAEEDRISYEYDHEH